jgi:hypothetical protein
MIPAKAVIPAKGQDHVTATGVIKNRMAVELRKRPVSKEIGLFDLWGACSVFPYARKEMQVHDCNYKSMYIHSI